MQLFQYHAIFDEITYDREILYKWYLEHQHLTDYFSDWIWKSCKGTGHKFRGLGQQTGFKVIDLNNTLGKWIKDEPCIKTLLDMWNFDLPLRNLDVDVLIYPKNYKLKPHIDANMQCGIMYPICPENPAPIDFYSVPPGDEIIPGKEYDVEKDRDLLYSYHYSSKHPSMFNGGNCIHGVENSSTERVFLRLKIMGMTFDDVIRKHNSKKLINANI
jgi:hypothetical protein